MNYNPIETGRRIKKVREEMGFSQESFSERLNISRNHLARIEVGLRSASIELLIAISEVTSLSLDYLAMGKEPDNARIKAELLGLAQSLIRLEKEL